VDDFTLESEHGSQLFPSTLWQTNSGTADWAKPQRNNINPKFQENFD